MVLHHANTHEAHRECNDAMLAVTEINHDGFWDGPAKCSAAPWGLMPRFSCSALLRDNALDPVSKGCSTSSFSKLALRSCSPRISHYHTSQRRPCTGTDEARALPSGISSSPPPLTHTHTRPVYFLPPGRQSGLHSTT